MKAYELAKLADEANDRNKILQRIISSCKEVAKNGYYSLSFNNYNLGKSFNLNRLVLYLEKNGFKVSDISTTRPDRATFIVSWAEVN